MEEPEYIVEDAAEMVYQNISEALQEKLSFDDIVEILEIEFEFLQKSGVTDNPNSIVTLPLEIDEEAKEYYIINRCAQEDIFLTPEELYEILDAETLYLESLGLIDEEGMAPFYN